MTTRYPLDQLLSGRTGRCAFHKRLGSLGFVLTESKYRVASDERVAESGLRAIEAFLARGVLKPVPPENDQKYVDFCGDVKKGSVCRPDAILAGGADHAPGNHL